MKYELELILEKVCNYYSVSEEDVKSMSRKGEFTLPRHVYLYLSFTMNKKKHNNNKKHFSLSEISKFINRDHATALYSINKINGYMSIYPDLKKEICEIIVNLQNSKKRYSEIVISEINLLEIAKNNCIDLLKYNR